MQLKFEVDRISSFQMAVTAKGKYAVLRKTRLKFLIGKKCIKKIILPNLRCRRRTQILLHVHQDHFEAIWHS